MNKEQKKILHLNQSHVPHVGFLEGKDLEDLLAMAAFQESRWEGERLKGFILGLLPGETYGSRNYRWFMDRWEAGAQDNPPAFLYIDRIAVDRDFLHRGIGRELYQAARRFCDDQSIPRICCEVNLEPPNDPSHHFHRTLGFQAVGDLEHDQGKRVCFYEWEWS